MAYAKLVSPFIWVRVIWAYHKGDFARARVLYDKFAAVATVTPLHRAFEATLVIQEMRYEEAKCLFMEIVDEISFPPYSGSTNYYIKLYCEYYISLANRDNKHEKIRREAKMIDIPKHVERTLPLSDEAIVID